MSDARDFLDHVELETITAYEERGRRWQEQTPPDELKTQSAMGFIAIDDQKFEYRFRVQFEDEHGMYVADFAALYASKRRLAVSREVSLEFAERVAFMTVYPYQRASIQASAARLGNPAPVLGMVRQGGFHLGTELSADEVGKVFAMTEGERLA